MSSRALTVKKERLMNRAIVVAICKGGKKALQAWEITLKVLGTVQASD